MREEKSAEAPGTKAERPRRTPKRGGGCTADQKRKGGGETLSPPRVPARAPSRPPQFRRRASPAPPRLHPGPCSPGADTPRHAHALTPPLLRARSHASASAHPSVRSTPPRPWRWTGRARAAAAQARNPPGAGGSHALPSRHPGREPRKATHRGGDDGSHGDGRRARGAGDLADRRAEDRAAGLGERSARGCADADRGRTRGDPRDGGAWVSKNLHLHARHRRRSRKSHREKPPAASVRS